MFRPVALFIGLRYTRAKQRNHFISFISLVSMLGIALGVMVLITVLSVMNGFDNEIKKRVFSMVAPITINSNSGSIANWKNVQTLLKKYSYIKSSAPFVSGEVLLNFGRSTQPAIISGILPTEEVQVSQIAQKLVYGKLTDLVPGEFGIILGENLAQQLTATLGDKIMVITPKVSFSPAGMVPRYRRFVVRGIFKAGGGFGFDRGLGFMHLADAQKLFGLGQNVSGLHLSVEHAFAAPAFAQQLRRELTDTAIISTWAEQFGEFFHAIQMEKTMMFLILLLLIAVAAFNLISTLIMVVNEKKSDIAILRTFGATSRTILTIFIIQGGIIGVVGTLIGTIGGMLLAWNVTELVNLIEHWFHVQLLSSNVYFVDYLPSEIQTGDIVKICCASLGLSLAATIYPAWRAAKTDPVEALRYE